MNVESAWDQGYTGKGVIVAVVDDGLEWTHRELKQSYDPEASTDINGKDSNPEPRYDFLNSNHQGTAVAGVIAAAPNNSFCGVGIAYGGKVGGIRTLDGAVSDPVEGDALSFNPEHIDIYCSGWGPNDDGKTLDGPGIRTQNALKNGTEAGRGGKGSIFVWANGGGRRNQDHCNTDGYVSSVYTVSIGFVTAEGRVPVHSEPCSAVLAVTFSEYLVTAGLRDTCKVL